MRGASKGYTEFSSSVPLNTVSLWSWYDCVSFNIMAFSNYIDFYISLKDALVGTSSGSMAVSNSINFTPGLSGNNHCFIKGREAD